MIAHPTPSLRRPVDPRYHCNHGLNAADKAVHVFLSWWGSVLVHVECAAAADALDHLFDMVYTERGLSLRERDRHELEALELLDDGVYDRVMRSL